MLVNFTWARWAAEDDAPAPELREGKEEVEGRLYMKHVFAHDGAASYISVISARMNRSECNFLVPPTAFLCINFFEVTFYMRPSFLLN